MEVSPRQSQEDIKFPEVGPDNLIDHPEKVDPDEVIIDKKSIIFVVQAEEILLIPDIVDRLHNHCGFLQK